MTPKRQNVRFYPTPAAAQEAGFRACKRCRPDAAPGSPEWNGRADLVARAVRLIGDGVVEREGIGGLSRRLGYSSRQLHRLVFAELGTGPLRLALAHRIQNARALIETTDMAMTDVAWASGFGSIRQFNDRIREVYAQNPTELRAKARAGSQRVQPSTSDIITARLAFRPPIDLGALLTWLGRRAVPGLESYQGGVYRRVLSLPHGPGLVAVHPDIPRIPRPYITCELVLGDVRDYSTAVSRVRRMLDLDADPGAVAQALGDDPVIGPLVRRRPGLRVPGAVDGSEMAFRALLGQQVSVAGARQLAARLVRAHGRPLAERSGDLAFEFPEPAALATIDPASLPVPRSRARAMVSLAGALAEGRVAIDPGADRDETEERLQDLPGIGPWTSAYVRMRALGDPDVFLGSDLAIKKAMGGRVPEDSLWKPWRSYATVHLWASLTEENQGEVGEQQGQRSVGGMRSSSASATARSPCSWPATVRPSWRLTSDPSTPARPARPTTGCRITRRSPRPWPSWRLTRRAN
jgi:AraC family transcriptional regulator of adaptative response / DNA-3-methyladenine glycosylase II